MVKWDNRPEAYMDQAEELLRRFVARHPTLRVWRVPRRPYERHPELGPIDTLLVAPPMADDPTRPAEPPLLRTFLMYYGDHYRADMFSAGQMSGSVTFGGNNVPLEFLKDMATWLPEE